jgi:hypothetical protein
MEGGDTSGVGVVSDGSNIKTEPVVSPHRLNAISLPNNINSHAITEPHNKIRNLQIIIFLLIIFRPFTPVFTWEPHIQPRRSPNNASTS